MNKRAKIFFILMMLLLLLPAVAMFGGQSASFTSEKIETDSLPAIVCEEGFNYNFFNECDDYISSHIGFRSQLIAANTAVFTKLFMMSPEDDVILGYNGWLYYSKAMDDYFNIPSVSDRGINNIAHSLKMLENAVEDENSEFILTFAPNKSTLYPEYMPLRYIQSDNVSNLDRLEDALEDNEVNYVSLKQLFEKDSQVYYRKKDSHWNYKGALKAYNAIMAASSLKYDTYSGLEFADSYEWTGDLSNMLYATEMTLDSQLTPMRSFGYQYTSKQKNVEANRIDTYNQDGEGSALIYRDSFGNTIIPFFAQNFMECHFSKITPYNLADVEDNTPDVTIIELVERNIPNMAKAAPVMLAPEVALDETGYMVTSLKPLYTEYYEESELGCHIYGAIDEEILGDSYSVYAMVDDGEGNVSCYEAFPIYEQFLIDEDEEGYPRDNGYSLYVPDKEATIINLIVATKDVNYIL